MSGDKAMLVLPVPLPVPAVRPGAVMAGCGALSGDRGTLEWLGCQRYRARVKWVPAGGSTGEALTVRLPWVLDVRDGRTLVILVPTSVTRGARARGGTAGDASLVVERILEGIGAATGG